MADATTRRPNREILFSRWFLSHLLEKNGQTREKEILPVKLGTQSLFEATRPRDLEIDDNIFFHLPSISYKL
jgi:hypothetical protein